MMASSISNVGSVHNNRGSRFASFDQMSNLSSPLDLGPELGGASGWKSNTWADRAGMTDRGHSNEMTLSGAKIDSPIEDKKGSSSLLQSSESEGWNRQSRYPWPGTNNISPTTQRLNGSAAQRGELSVASDLQSHHLASSNPRSGLYRAVGEPTLPLGWNSLALSSQPDLDPNSFPALGDVRAGKGSSSASSLKTNFDTPLMLTNSLRQFNTTPSDSSSPAFHAFRPTSSSRTNSEQAPFPPNTFVPKVINPHGYSPIHRPFHSTDASIDLTFQEIMSQRQVSDENLISELEKLNLHASQQLQRNEPQYRPSSSRQMSQESFGRNPVRSASEDRFPAGPHLNSNAVDRGYQHHPAYNRTPFAVNGGGSYSPSITDSGRDLMTPLTSTASTPPLERGSVRGNSRSGSSQRGFNGMQLDRRLHGLQSYPKESHFASNMVPMRGQYQPDVNYAPSMPMNPLARPYPTTGYNPYSSLTPAAPNVRPFRRGEIETHQVMRSPLLEDFRTSNKTNKKFELKDIYNYVVEFSGDQYGSRFIQLKLETANSDEKEQVFTEIQPNAIQLMTDVFGNYVIQKLFEHGNQTQKKLLANQMKGHILTLSTQMYGCRVVQKVLEHVLVDQQASIVKELDNHVIRCVKDQNGNHVIQKAIERVPAQHIQFIISAFHGQVSRLAAHPYGCRVIQRMLEHCEPISRQSLLIELHHNVPALISDQYGNYVIQHIIQHGDEKDRFAIISIIISHLFVYSKHKFASNVVEKSIDFAEIGQRTQMLRMLSTADERGENPALTLVKDQYGNYVIQKVFSHLRGHEREVLVEQIRTLLVQMRKFNYGKQVNAIEKIIAMTEQDSGSYRSASTHGSSLPSTNASTVEGPIGAATSISSGETARADKPEAVISDLVVSAPTVPAPEPTTD